jgi:hypothetical protein
MLRQPMKIKVKEVKMIEEVESSLMWIEKPPKTKKGLGLNSLNL